MPTYDLAYTECPVCRTNKISIHHRDFRDNRIFRCGNCGVQFMNPIYSDDHLRRFYAEYYSGGMNQEQVVIGQEKTNRIKLHAIERFMKNPGKALDFGCGNGNFIKAALSKGWHTVGYDVDCDTTRQVAESLNVEVRCGDLHTIDWPAASFDLLHAHHVVEHLKYPVRDISRLNHWLKPGGYFYVAVPNISALATRLKFGLEKIGVRRKNIGRYYDSDHHVFYYSPKSMRWLLQRCGFEVVMTMNGNKTDIGDSKLARFSYTFKNYLYASAAFFMIARKIRDI